MNVRMKRDYTYDLEGEKGVKHTLPAGWVGEVDDEIGEAAVKAKAAINTDAEAEGDSADAKKKAPASSEAKK